MDPKQDHYEKFVESLIEATKQQPGFRVMTDVLLTEILLNLREMNKNLQYLVDLK